MNIGQLGYVLHLIGQFSWDKSDNCKVKIKIEANVLMIPGLLDDHFVSSLISKLREHPWD